MIGVIDIGNTNIHCALFESLEIKETKIINNILKIKDFFSEVNEIMMISVDLEREKIVRDILNIPIIDFPKTLIELDYQSDVGCDRLANGISAKESHGLPAIVVDCGSAITVDLFLEPSLPNGKYTAQFGGGAILPGLDWYFLSLSKGKALPSMEPALQNTIGKSTTGCLKLGAYGAFVGGIGEILTLFNYQNKNLIFTGGDGRRFLKFFKADYDPVLTLKGGIIAYHKISS